MMERLICRNLAHRRGQHPFEPAHPIAQVDNLLAQARHVGRHVADALVEQDDLAERADRIAIKAHARAAFLLFRTP